MRRAPLALAAVVALAAPAQAEGDCAARLEATLQAMLDRPLLKEEHATGLMWLRMDAEEALAEGDVATCLDLVRQVEALLGIDAADGA